MARAEARSDGRLQRADESRRVGSGPLRDLESTYARALVSPTSKDQEVQMRAEDFELTLRLEARDLSLYFEFEQQVCTLPLRTGARCAGAVQATIIQPNQLKVTWS